MRHGFVAFVLAAVLAPFGLNSTTNAATVVVTGVDLLTRPGVSFPSITPSVSGTSLFFGSTATFSKLISINLDPSPDTSYSLVLNFTRMPATYPAYDEDHDLHMVLSDGTNMVGAMYGDNTNGTIGGVTFLDGQSSQVDGRVFTSTVTETGFPTIGQTFDYALDFSLASGSTTVTGRLYDAATTVVETSRALNPAATHSLVLVSDEPHTQYQLNSVTFVTDPDPGELLQQLLADVTGVGPGKNLSNKVKLAQTYYTAGDIPATCAVLTDFVLTVSSMASGKKPKLSAAIAAELTADAEAIMEAIGCS